MLSTFISILIGVASFFDYVWFHAGHNVLQAPIAVILAILALLVFITYRGPKNQIHFIWKFEQGWYWNIRRGLQFVVLIGTIGVAAGIILNIQ
ncbi:MAG: hypothetical protein LBM27_03555 [Lactobacillaceae bacterium]|jgi:hypothetical protein|nr:hypothetical protein [Lactobacillaceae bacterium]